MHDLSKKNNSGHIIIFQNLSFASQIKHLKQEMFKDCLVYGQIVRQPRSKSPNIWKVKNNVHVHTVLLKVNSIYSFLDIKANVKKLTDGRTCELMDSINTKSGYADEFGQHFY